MKGPDHLQLQRLHELGLIDDRALRRAEALTGRTPHGQRWRGALDMALAAGGAALLASGLLFFFAYNWSALGQWTRFAIIAAVLLTATAVSAWRGLDSPAGSAAAGLAWLTVGVLLAVYGQTYQTGADAHGLFVTWLALVTPWTLAARNRGLWCLWLLLANVALGLYWIQMVSPRFGWLARASGELGPVGWLAYLWQDTLLGVAAFVLNAGAAAVAEWWLRHGGPGGRVLPRLAALLALTALTMPTLRVVLAAKAGDPGMLLAPALWVITCVLGWLWYVGRGADLLLVAAIYLSAVVVATVGLVWLMMETPAAWLLVATLVVAMASAAAVALRQHARSLAQRS